VAYAHLTRKLCLNCFELWGGDGQGLAPESPTVNNRASINGSAVLVVVLVEAAELNLPAKPENQSVSDTCELSNSLL